MKIIQRATMLALLAGVLTACSNNANTTASNNDSAATTAGQGAYQCPMHPDVTGKQGDTCPKCGMKLEPAANAATSGYYMDLQKPSGALLPNTDVKLLLTPRLRGQSGEPPVLDVQHEKKIHLILVSDDLSWFDHLHPEHQAGGAYAVTARFPAPGKYTVFADYKPSGGAPVVNKLEIDVDGNAPAPAPVTGEKLSGTSGTFGFALQPAGGRFYSGGPVHIEGTVTNNGKPIDANTLNNYLGAKAHVVVISQNEKEYLHVHPAVANGKFDLQTRFPKPGPYRGWVQFNAGGRLHTVDFAFTVVQGRAADAQKASPEHDGDAAEHSSHH